MNPQTLQRDTTLALGGVGAYDMSPDEVAFLGAVETVGAQFGFANAQKMLQQAGSAKYGPSILQKAAPVMQRIAQGQAVPGGLMAPRVAPVSFPGSSGQALAPSVPDYNAFRRVARIQNRLTFKLHKSGNFQPAATLFTPDGATQFLTLNPNATRNLINTAVITPAAAITQLQFNDNGLQQLRLNIACTGFSFYLKIRNGTGAGLAITQALFDEMQEQTRIGVYNNGVAIDNDIFLNEIPTPGQSRLYPVNDANLFAQRGEYGLEASYTFPSPVVIKNNAAVGFVLQRVPAAIAAAVNNAANFPLPGNPGDDSAFTIGIMLHNAIQESDWNLLAGAGAQMGAREITGEQPGAR